MIKINEIENLGLKITWKLLYLGFSKNNSFDRQIYLNDIIKYAINQVELGEKNDLIYQLMCVYDYEELLALDILYKLGETENSCYNIEIRKIKVLIAYKCTLVMNNNYIDGLNELYDLYFKLGEPENMPMVIQGVNNFITPKEYFKEQTYEMLYNKIRNWIERELKFLKEYDLNKPL